MKQVLLLLKLAILSNCRVYGFHVYFDNGSQFEGRIEIQYHDDKWGRVCDSGLNLNDTQVVSCRQLNFKSGQEATNDHTDETYHYGRSNDTVWFVSVSCNGTESALEKCSHGELDSTHERDSGLYCTSNSTSGDLSTNNNTEQFSCNIDFQLSEGDSGKIMDRENIYSTLPVIAMVEAIRIVLSGHHNNTMIIINNNNNATPTWVVVSAIGTGILAVLALIGGLYKCLQKMPDAYNCITRYVRRDTEPRNHEPNSRLANEQRDHDQCTDHTSNVKDVPDSSSVDAGYNSRSTIGGGERTQMSGPVSDTDHEEIVL